MDKNLIGAKTMARYIEEDLLTHNICRMGVGHLGEFAICDVVKVVRAMPTADVKEIVKGEWIRNIEYLGVMQCSNCKVEYLDTNFNYCPNCGADMRGVEVENE